jgi:DNA-binding XRE family transcriptional regulator
VATRWVFSPEKLRTQRRGRALSRARLASSIDVGEGAAQSWEEGTAQPRLATYLRLVEALHCEVTDLLVDLHTDDEASMEASSKMSAPGQVANGS